MKHLLHKNLVTSKVRVAVIGCGGIGSRVLTGLACLHKGMIEVGHPAGLHVTAFDPKFVSRANVGRQPFSAADVGISKAMVLIHRINMYHGLNWQAQPTVFGSDIGIGAYDLVVACVDTKDARRKIARVCSEKDIGYWLDTGNRRFDGQAILGEPLQRYENPKRPMRLPTVVELFPEILDETVPEDDTPSCSLEEALEHQDLFIGQAVADCALQILWRLFRFGGLDYHGQFVNLEAGMTTPLPVDPETWARFKPKKTRKRKPSQKKQECAAKRTGT